MSQVLIRAESLSKIYRSRDVATVALENVNLSVQEGEFLAIMGPSGCGKSTLLNLMGLLDTPTEGNLYFMGKDVKLMKPRDRTHFRRKHIGFVFQNFNLIEELTVYENIELPLLYQKVDSKERDKRVQKVMDEMKISHKQHFFPLQLSGGQQQRVAVCRAVVSAPDVLLADEPTGNLDSVHGQEVMNTLARLNERGTTVVIVTHSPAYASYGQRVVNLFDGHIVTDALMWFFKPQLLFFLFF